MKTALISIAFMLSVYAHAGSMEKAQVIEVKVTEKGFEPSEIKVSPDHPITLKVTRKTDSTCATAIQIPDKKIKKDLPLNQTVTLDLGSLKKGDLKFGCGMKMMESGNIKVQ